MAVISGQNLGLALAQYLEQELAPKSSGLSKVGLYLAIPVVAAKAQELVEHNKSALDALGVLSPDGHIDIDVAYPLVKDAVKKAGKVPVMGIIFDESDIDKINVFARQLV